MRSSEFIWSQRRVPGNGVRNSALRVSTPIAAGRLGDSFADARLVDIQTDDEGAHDQDLVPLDAPHRGRGNPGPWQG